MFEGGRLGAVAEALRPLQRRLEALGVVVRLAQVGLDGLPVLYREAHGVDLGLQQIVLPAARRGEDDVDLSHRAAGRVHVLRPLGGAQALQRVARLPRFFGRRRGRF